MLYTLQHIYALGSECQKAFWIFLPLELGQMAKGGWCWLFLFMQIPAAG